MSKLYFVLFSTDPEVDPRKCAVGMSCASQIASDGHTIDVFFAAHAVRLLHTDYINALDEQAGQAPGSCRAILDSLVASARGIYCSTGSQALVGVTPDNAGSVLVPGLELHWSGPPGVSTLSASADHCLSF